jgi:hypothetical protein
VEAARDLGRVDPWQESLERSLARRGKRPGSADAGHTHRAAHRAERHRPERIPRRPADHIRGPERPRPRRPRLANKPRLLAVGSWGALALTVIMVTVAGLVDGHGAQASAGAHGSATASRTGLVPKHFTPLPPTTRGGAPKATPVRAARTCRPVPKSSGYANPIAGDTLISERIDQGVDYAGTGTLKAIGAARITYVGTGETGWPGAFIEFRLLDGPDAGCFVYYAEGINPTAGLRPGQRVGAGQVLAHIIPGWSTGIELGWGGGDNTKTYAEKSGKWTATDDANSVASAAGKSFSALIAALGGPPGRVEG